MPALLQGFSQVFFAAYGGEGKGEMWGTPHYLSPGQGARQRAAALCTPAWDRCRVED